MVPIILKRIFLIERKVHLADIKIVLFTIHGFKDFISDFIILINDSLYSFVRLILGKLFCLFEGFDFLHGEREIGIFAGEEELNREMGTEKSSIGGYYYFAG